MIVLRGFGWVLVALVVAAVSGWLHLSGPFGRSAAKALVNETLSGTFRGELSVESVDALAFGSASVSGFEVRDLDGEVVFFVDRGRLELEPLPLLFGGTVTLRNVVAEGGRLVLRRGRESSVSISEAFGSVEPSGGPSRALDLGWMVAHDLDLQVALTNPTLAFAIDEASVQLVREEGAEIQVDLANVDATMTRPSTIGPTVRVVGASGEVRPKTDQLLALDSGACVGDSPLLVRVRYGRDGPAALTLDHADGGGFFASLVMRVVGLFSDSLEIDERSLPGQHPSCG